jgi:hypothetical protein
LSSGGPFTARSARGSEDFEKIATWACGIDSSVVRDGVAYRDLGGVEAGESTGRGVGVAGESDGGCRDVGHLRSWVFCESGEVQEDEVVEVGESVDDNDGARGSLLAFQT